MSLVEMWGVGLNFGVEVLRFFFAFLFFKSWLPLGISYFFLCFLLGMMHHFQGLCWHLCQPGQKKKPSRQTSWIFRGVCECFRFEKTSRNECFRFEKTFPKKPKIWDTFSSSEDKTWKFLCWWMTGFNRIWRNRGGWISVDIMTSPQKTFAKAPKFLEITGLISSPHFLGGGGLGTRNWGYLNCLFFIKMR